MTAATAAAAHLIRVNVKSLRRCCTRARVRALERWEIAVRKPRLSCVCARSNHAFFWFDIIVVGGGWGALENIEKQHFSYQSANDIKKKKTKTIFNLNQFSMLKWNTIAYKGICIFAV